MYTNERPYCLSTEIPGLTVEILGPADVPELCTLIEKNRDYLLEAGEHEVVIDAQRPRQLARQIKKHSYPPTDATFGIRHHGGLVGEIATSMPWYSSVSEISGWVDQGSSGNGYASTALIVLSRAILAEGYGVRARARLGNQRSTRAIKRAGFTQIQRQTGQDYLTFVLSEDG